jgi:hypothetical protein
MVTPDRCMADHHNIFCELHGARAKLIQDEFGSQRSVKTQRPIATEEEHRVIQFRPRNPVRPPAWRANTLMQPVHKDTVPEPLDLSRYERPVEEPDDFRHRMLANIAAFAFTVALTAIGIWLAMSIADMRRTQDCVLMGRRDCVRISTPDSPL